MSKSNRRTAKPPDRARPAPPFPPQRDYTSLSIEDLLDAREAYHVHLSRLQNVAATAIGRYLIHERDWYATYPPDRPRPADVPRIHEAKTLANTVVRPWSWPAVLVFVRHWQSAEKLGADAVPRALYLPDGRVVPTCVVLAPPEEELPPASSPGPAPVSGFVAAAGVLAHYVGDASQPLHCSYLHHGLPPMTTVNGRPYPKPRSSPEFEAFKKTRPAQIHGIYEETMLEIDPASALADVDRALGRRPRGTLAAVASGHAAAVATVRLMFDARKRLPPTTIIAADDPTAGPKARAQALWSNAAIRAATIASLADSTGLLAHLWSAAWKAGNGAAVPGRKLVAFAEQDLDATYRHDRGFVPSLTLAAMVESGRFEP